MKQEPRKHRLSECRQTVVLLVAAAALLRLSQALALEAAWEPARPFGYVIGEVIPLTASVAVEPRFQLDTTQLPQAGQPLNDWLEVRDVHWQQQRSDPAVYRVTVAYQVFAGVKRAEVLTVPPLALHFRAGDEALEAQTPPWEFALAAQIPSYVRDEDVAIRPARAAPQPSLFGPAAGLAVSLAGGLAALGWLAWLQDWLPWLARRPGPFARACRALRRDGDYLAALRTVHRAFNDTVGGALFAGQSDEFLQRHPAYAPLAEEIRAFYSASRLALFADQADSDAFPLPRLLALCRACRVIERSRPWR